MKTWEDDVLDQLETQFSKGIHDVRSEMGQHTHPQDVYAWRLDQFERMGFKLATARWLASTRIELRRMEKLIGAKCPPDLAIDILEGTNFSGEDPVFVPQVEVDDEET